MLRRRRHAAAHKAGLSLDGATAEKLRGLRVGIDVHDGNTVVLVHVPVCAGHFNKTHTNVLVARPAAGAQFVVGVDADLEYAGHDRTLSGAFARAMVRAGWKTILVEPVGASDFESAVGHALAALGCFGGVPALPAAARTRAEAPGRSGDSLLDTWGNDLSALVGETPREPTCGRERLAAYAVSCVLGWSQTRMPIVTGEAGTGKTNFLYEMARRLAAAHHDSRLVRVDLGPLLAGSVFSAERESMLAKLLDEAVDDRRVVLALEHIELPACETEHGLFMLAGALERGARIAGTVLPQFRERLSASPIAWRICWVDLAEPSPEEVRTILLALRQAIQAHHAVHIDEQLADMCVRASLRLQGTQPAKAIALLDSAAAMAAVSQAQAIGPEDIMEAAARQSS